MTKMMSPNELRRLRDGLVRHSLRSFIEQSFYTLNPGQEFLPARHIDVMAYRLEQVAEGNIQRLAIALAPRHLKSHCVSVAFPAWLLGRNPTRRIIAASYNADLAETFSHSTRRIMQQDWYRRVFPHTAIDPKRNSVDEFHKSMVRQLTSVHSAAAVFNIPPQAPPVGSTSSGGGASRAKPPPRAVTLQRRAPP